MRLFFLHSVVVLFLFYIVPGYSQEVSVTAKTDKPEYLIGDYIRLQIQVTQTGKADIQFPATDSIAAFDKITVSPVDTLSNGNTIQYSQELVYSIYDSGVYTINPIKVIYKIQEDANSYLAQTDTLQFTVHTMSVDTTLAIKPIKDIIQVRAKSYLTYYILGAIAALLLIVFIVYKIFKNRKKIVPEKPKQPALSLYESTMKQLQELDEKRLWQQNETKQYYIELTEITRTYIEKRFELPALENTSDEIIESLVQRGIDTGQIHHISTVLRYADLAKFAKSRPFAAENTLAMQYIKEFVEKTQNPGELK